MTLQTATNEKATDEKAAGERKAGGEVDEIELTAQAAEQDARAQIRGERMGVLSVYGCPDCGGVLWQVPFEHLLVFRCHIGHVLSAENLLEQQFSTVEAAGWTAVRALTDRSRLLLQMSLQARGQGDADEAARLDGLAAVVADRVGAFRALMEAGE